MELRVRPVIVYFKKKKKKKNLFAVFSILNRWIWDTYGGVYTHTHTHTHTNWMLDDQLRVDDELCSTENPKEDELRDRTQRPNPINVWGIH